MDQVAIPCTIMRGGTSKGLFFLDSDLPSDIEVRGRILLAAFGSPDPRQIDGLGGADPLTSKLAIIRPSVLPEVDLEYTFGQVSITEGFIDFSANCGNISSAVGPFAIDKGLMEPEEPSRQVRILNTNTGKTIVAVVPCDSTGVRTEGDYSIDGVPGSGAEIKMRFLDPGGGTTGKLLPTGRSLDTVVLENGKAVEVTIVDAGNPAVFVSAEQIGLRGDELPSELESSQKSLAILDELRAKTSELLGFSSSWVEARGHYTSIPKIAFVARPAPFRTLQGDLLEGEQVDLLARVMSMGRLHKAYAVTAAIPTAAASRIAGSVVERLCRQGGRTVSIGHPSGVLSVDIEVGEREEGVQVREVVLGRTARKLMDGKVFVSESIEAAGGPRRLAETGGMDSSPLD